MKISRGIGNLPLLQAFRGHRRGRLVRHYFFILVVLIGGALLTSGLLEVYFRYQESWEHVSVLQQEVAAGAAFKIQRFIQDIEHTMQGATKSRGIALNGLSQEYRFELEKLLMMAPPITEVEALDSHGSMKLRVSRLRMAIPDDRRDLSASAAYRQAMQGRSYFGPVYFVRDSEPYMTMAVPIERFAGEVIGVLQAEVNLKYIWDVVSDIKVGKAGYAYTVTRSGDLIAHPDISLVLQRRNLAGLNQVKAAFRPTPFGKKPEGLITDNPMGKKVFSSYAVIPRLDWAVFTEQPLEEVYGPLYASMLRTSSILMVGLGMALLATLFVARRVVQPLRSKRQGVERIGRGDLGFRLDIKTGDEMELLSEEFNKMTGALQEAYTGLEQKVIERTKEITLVNQRLDEASKHKSQFLANVSHELRTPLNAIIGFTRVVLRKTEGQIEDLQRENLQKVLVSAERLLDLINGLLDLSKIEAGRMEVLPETFRLEEVVEKAVSTVEPMIRDGTVRLAREIAPDVQPVNTDREKLEQILLNLLSNAAKFTERGEIRISGWQESGFLKVAISDTGVGIEREALQYIFEEFRRANAAGKKKFSGTGLGLAIVKRLVTLLGGDVSVESEPGKGSTFTVKVPIRLMAD